MKSAPRKSKYIFCQRTQYSIWISKRNIFNVPGSSVIPLYVARISLILFLVLPDRWYLVIQGRHWSRRQSKSHWKPVCFRQVFIIRIKSHSILPGQFSNQRVGNFSEPWLLIYWMMTVYSRSKKHLLSFDIRMPYKDGPWAGWPWGI